MKRQELEAEFQRLKNQYDQIVTLPEEFDIVKSMACQNLCVSICGSIEQYTKSIMVQFSKNCSSDRIHRPVHKLCEGYQNPKPAKMVELISLFDSDFAKILEARWKDDDSPDGGRLGNMVDDRINIAHRKKNHMDISVSKLNNYLKLHRSILSELYDKFL